MKKEIAATLLTGTLLFGGCKVGEKEDRPRVVESLPINAPVRQILEVVDYLELSSHKAKQRIDINTSLSQTEFLVYDEGIEIDPSVAKETINYFEEYSKTFEKKMVGVAGTEKSQVPLIIFPNQSKKNYVFLVADGTDLPNWFRSDLPAASKDMSDNLSTSVIRISEDFAKFADFPKGEPFQNFINLAFIIESCQRAVRVGTTREAIDIEGEKILGIIQELLCNSFGRAFTARQLGVSPNEYEEFSKKSSIVGPNEQREYPLSQLSKEDYINIPNIGLPIFKK